MSANNESTARLLQRVSAGDSEAYDALFAAVYEDLRRRARKYLRGSDATISTTALVHETYLNLAGADLSLNDRQHFFRVAAQAMRQALIDSSRRSHAVKRGAGIANVTLDTSLPAVGASIDMLALDEALARLGSTEPRLAAIVDLHFFAGLEFVEIAGLMQLSARTVARDWRAARALLQMALAGPIDDADGAACA